MSKTQKVQTVAPFQVVKSKTGSTITLNAQFKKELVQAGTEVGGFIQTAQEKLRMAMNLVSAFNAYKKETSNGLPAFVHDLLDATCPKSYGKVGSDDRKTLNSHVLFNGIEYLYKKGKIATDKAAEVKALKDAGVDVDDNEEVQKHNKETRDAKRDAFQSAFTRCMVGFDKFGVTETTISNMLVLMGKHEKNSKDELNKVGETLRDAAVKAIFAQRERTTRDVTPSDAPKSKANKK